MDILHVIKIVIMPVKKRKTNREISALSSAYKIGVDNGNSSFFLNIPITIVIF